MVRLRLKDNHVLDVTVKIMWSRFHRCLLKQFLRFVLNCCFFSGEPGRDGLPGLPGRDTTGRKGDQGPPGNRGFDGSPGTKGGRGKMHVN